MVAKTVQSRKAKGRNLQKEVVSVIIKNFPHLSEDDVRSTSSGAAGEDVLLSKAARAVFPFSIECKATERFNLWDAYKQAESNAGEYEPLVIHRKNRTKPVAIVSLEYLVDLHKQCDALAKKIESLQNGSSK